MPFNDQQFVMDNVLGTQFKEDSGLKFDERTTAIWQTNNAMRAAIEEAFGLTGVEDSRFASQSQFLTGEFERSNAGFDDSIKRLEGLRFSQAADSAGRGAAEGLSRLRSSIGARGLDPNSGLAAGLARGIADKQSGQVIGAQRDIALESERLRRDQRLQRLSGAFQLGNFRNQSPSMIKLDTLGSLTSTLFGREQSEEQKQAARNAAKAAKTGALIGGAGKLAGLAFGGL
ncbi:MAG: hypothetical protein GY946_04965 [bacterium]|nr:hypothetical protein [bacterium]